MISVKRKTCKCGYEGFFPGKKCKKCKFYEKPKQNTKANATPKKKTFTYKRKATGEKELFQRIWEVGGTGEDKQVSFVSGVQLGTDGRSWHFSHVLPKGRYPEARLDEENIVLKTLEEHELWENHQYKLINDPKWHHVFKLKHKLLLKYGYNIPPNEEHIR